MGLLSDFDSTTGEHTLTQTGKILKAPFGYQGGKQRSVKEIVPKLPRRSGYIEPFGGSAAVLLAKAPSQLEVFNDTYAGVVALYTCIRDPLLLDRLIARLELTLHSREEFITYKATWEGCGDVVERAARWYAMQQYSFSGKGVCWGRSLANTSFAGKVQRALASFPSIHERMKNVTIENRDGLLCMQEYDNVDHVLYLDPPYIDSSKGIYDNEPDYNYHRRLLNWIFDHGQGFFAVSGYANGLYDSYPWDHRYTWDVFVSSASVVNSAKNRKQNISSTRGRAVEVLWIKEEMR